MSILNKVLSILKNISNKYILKLNRSEKEKLLLYKKDFPNVLTTTETIDYIISNNSSICRFGDAEFDICNQENKLDPYQIPSDELTKRLEEILNHQYDKNILVCIPPFNSNYNNIRNYYKGVSFWEWYWLKKYQKIRPLLKCDTYGNSFVSRDTVFYENKLEDIKRIWDKRDVVFVYGKNGRFNSNSCIFNNIKNKTEILIPPVNAFSKYDEILNQCKKYDKNKLFLIAAGPTACILAYDLSKFGYQALDIGHIPNCYDQYRGLSLAPEELPMIKNKE